VRGKAVRYRAACGHAAFKPDERRIVSIAPEHVMLFECVSGRRWRFPVTDRQSILGSGWTDRMA